MIKFRVKDEGPHIDDERLIEEVREHQFLYDTRSPDYRNLPLRATVWAEIAKNLSIDDQNIVQKRWKVLREKFSVAYRKFVLDEISPKTNWQFYDSLTFLEPFVNLRPENKKSTQSDDKITKYEPSVSRSPLDEQNLIQLIKERPVLYDKKHEDFRIGDSRKKAWLEIAEIVGWDVDTLQKRWRVMRDRFVRELRRTKNNDNDTHINCSQFFREMLFLTHHVRSKKYEVEAHFDNSNDDDEEYEWNQKEEPPVKIEILGSECVQQENYDQHYEQYLEEVEFEEETLVEEEVEHPNNENEYIEHIIIENDSQNEEAIFENENNDEVVKYEAMVQQNLSETHDETINKKRRISDENHEQQPPMKTKRVAETSQISSTSNDPTDEDIAFGNTLGCMLKKIPQHLKTGIKLKLLQSFAEFEAQHKLG